MGTGKDLLFRIGTGGEWDSLEVNGYLSCVHAAYLQGVVGPYERGTIPDLPGVHVLAMANMMLNVDGIQRDTDTERLDVASMAGQTALALTQWCEGREWVPAGNWGFFGKMIGVMEGLAVGDKD